MQIELPKDITRLTPDQYHTAIVIRAAELEVSRTHFVAACSESVGQPMGVMTHAEAERAAQGYREAVEALGYGRADARRGLLDETDLFHLQQRVIGYGMALYAAPVDAVVICE